jgi:glycosyltransferase involved in cell wall biosynthesis
VCPQGTRPGEDALAEYREGIEIRRYPLRPADGGMLGFLREYAQALLRTRALTRRLTRERPFDVVHTCNPPDFLLLAAGPARRAGARLVFDHHDLTPELFQVRFGDGRAWLRRLTLLVERLCMRSADAVIATNESYAELVHTRDGRRAEDVFVVRNGPELRSLRSAAPNPALARGREHLIAYVGMMAPQDGVEQALQALARLAQRRTDWHAVLAGDGPSREELIALRDRLGLSEQVEFAGWLGQREVASLLASSDVGLAPEPSSPLNDVSTMIKVAEYMAHGVPVVAYDLRETRRTAGDGALYAGSGDVGALAECIERLLESSELRDRTGREGRERVESELSWEHSERSLRGAYVHVLGSGRAAKGRRR